MDELLERRMVFEGTEEKLQLLVADHLGQLLLIIEQVSFLKDGLVCTVI